MRDHGKCLSPHGTVVLYPGSLVGGNEPGYEANGTGGASVVSRRVYRLPSLLFPSLPLSLLPPSFLPSFPPSLPPSPSSLPLSSLPPSLSLSLPPFLPPSSLPHSEEDVDPLFESSLYDCIPCLELIGGQVED